LILLFTHGELLCINNLSSQKPAQIMPHGL
jgi:hypothetical protein